MPETTISASPSKHLSSWWRSFKQRDESNNPTSRLSSRPHLPHMSRSSSAIINERFPSDPVVEVTNQGKKTTIPAAVIESPIFGVPLATSIKYASVRISLTDKDGESFVYGYVPVVVAKTAMYIKKEGKDMDGIFRVSGSARRVNVLKDVFNLAPRFGKDVDWQGFSVHDASSLLRRYFTSLPESIIPLKGYEAFRAPILDAPQLRAYMENQAALLNPALAEGVTEIKMSSDIEKQTGETIEKYQRLIFTLPPINVQLLVYLLDLLSVIATNAELNRMPAYNLSAVFQPTILSNPDHLSPEEYEVSRLVVEFIILHSAPILQKVEALAMEEHEKLKQLRNIKTDAEDVDPLDAAPPAPVAPSGETGRPSAAPEATEAAEIEDQDVTEMASEEQSFPGKIPTMRLEEDDSNDPADCRRHRRRHSKSLSSVPPPIKSESRRTTPVGWPQKKPGKDGEPTNDSIVSLDAPQTSSTTSFEETQEPVVTRPRKESIKSRWRRSLMILRSSGQDEDDDASLSPSISWFKSKKSGNEGQLGQSPSP